MNQRLRATPPPRAATLTLGLASIVATLTLSRESTAAGKPWIDMDYGPCLTAALEVAKGNIAHKGIAIRLDGGEGGVTGGSEFVVFDTDTLRYAAGWVGPEFVDWRSIVYDGSHQTHLSIRGNRLFTNPLAPGWSSPTGSFDDIRVRGKDGVAYGPLPRDWAHWKGRYVHGDRVVLSYTVGNVGVLELPAAETHDGTRALTRTIHLGPRSTDLVLQVAHDPKATIALRDFQNERSATRQLAVFVKEATEPPAAAPTRAIEFDGASSLEVSGSQDFDLTGSDFSIYARIKTTRGGTILAKAPPAGEWAPNGKTFFVRGGRLCYDIGWVGVVQSKRRVNDGTWHEVAVTFEQASGIVKLYVDGDPSGERELRPKARVRGQVRLGYTSPDFPEPSPFVGEMSDVRFYQRLLAPEEIASIAASETDERLLARWVDPAGDERMLNDATGRGHTATRTTARSQAPEEAPHGADGVAVVAMLGGPEGASWLATDDGHLRLRIPRGAEATSLKLLHSQVDDAGRVEPFVDLVRAAAPPMDLQPFTRGGPTRWREKPTTTTQTLGGSDGPYVVETITTPHENPYRAWMRLGGFDFFRDGRRAAVCTWMGDVWVVHGLGGDFEKFTWQRVASGLYQGLGLKIVDEEIYVLGRDQITRLHDLNGDGEADFYENFNNDAQATEHFHEFAMDLQTDTEGNFYYMKGGRHALDSVVPQHGSLLKVSKDGSRTEYVAYGFRAPNGLCLNPDGGFLTSDQEGHWTPANRINWIKPGGFYGYMWAYHRGERPTTYDKPLCWIDPEFDRSPAAQLWVASERWGPLEGKILSLSYGTGNVNLVMHEEVDGQIQGGVVKLPIPVFPTGIMRGRFHEGDGQLYVCGLFGWSSNRTLPGGFYRVRYTGKPLHAPRALHATTSGVVLSFSEPLDARRASRAGSYQVDRWNFKWAERYGSDDFRVSDGKRGREEVAVKTAHVSSDGRKVFLEIDDMRPCMQMRIRYRLRAADGARMSEAIYHTIHALGDDAPHRRGS